MHELADGLKVYIEPPPEVRTRQYAVNDVFIENYLLIVQKPPKDAEYVKTLERLKVEQDNRLACPLFAVMLSIDYTCIKECIGEWCPTSRVIRKWKN